MKFGHEYEQALASEGFPRQWLESAIDYKYLKKCIKKVRRELLELGLDANTLDHLNLEDASESPNSSHSSTGTRLAHEYYSAALPSLDSIPEEFAPQLRVLVDARNGMPLDATLAPETKNALQRLARHEMITNDRREGLGLVLPGTDQTAREDSSPERDTPRREREPSVATLPDVSHETKWVQIPLASAQYFFSLLEPKLEELEQLRDAETHKLEDEILALGDAIEDVVQPVREGFEAKRRVSYRDLYFWREMFRLYTETPIFYSELERNRGALTFAEAKARLEAYDQQLRSTGLLAKMKSPQALTAAKKFLDLNVDILRIMHFQEMNGQAMTKILKKFGKRTHLQGQLFLRTLHDKYPSLMPAGGKTVAVSGFAQSIAHDLHCEIMTKVVPIVPQIDDWNCPVCLSMAWRPVNLGCCRSFFCIRCIIKLQDNNVKRCPCCNAESVTKADGRNIDFEAMDFLEKYFPLEVKARQKENEKAMLVRDYGEEFVKPGCAVM